MTRPDGIYRFQKTRLPKDYLAKVPAEHGQIKRIEAEELPFEFMMNALRLNNGVNAEFYVQRTGLELNDLDATLKQLREKKLLIADVNRIACTEQGHIF